MEAELAFDFFAIIGQFLMVFLIIGLAFYVYSSLAFMAMAKKTNTENGWMAWVPILNIYLMVKIAGKPGWWFILMLIPFVNFIVAIIIWMAIAERCGKASWMGLLILVPIANIILPGLLAWSGDALVVENSAAAPVTVNPDIAAPVQEEIPREVINEDSNQE